MTPDPQLDRWQAACNQPTGRETEVSQDVAHHRTDFEVIRRKYRHVVEIVTYDDLFRRLTTIRDQFKMSLSTPVAPPSPFEASFELVFTVLGS